MDFELISAHFGITFSGKLLIRAAQDPRTYFCEFGSDSDGLNIELDMFFLDPNACRPFQKIAHIDQSFHEIVVQSHTKTITRDYQKRDNFSASILTCQVAPK